jgi:hypothetical protein
VKSPPAIGTPTGYLAVPCGQAVGNGARTCCKTVGAMSEAAGIGVSTFEQRHGRVGWFQLAPDQPFRQNSSLRLANGESPIRRKLVTQRLLRITLAAVAVAGCAKPQSPYQSSVAISPTGEPHIFVVQFTVSENGRGAQPTMIAAPKLIVASGQQGEVRVCDSAGRDGVTCTATVTEFDDHTEAWTRVLVRRTGTEVLDSSQSTVLHR